MTNYRKPIGFETRLVAAVLALAALNSFADTPPTELVFVGSGHRNIQAYQLNMTAGTLVPTGETAQVAAPSFLAVTPNQKFLYAISEGQTTNTSFVNAFQIDSPTGKLTLLNQQLTGGAGPCFVEVDQGGRFVLVANYNTGSVAVFFIEATGALGAMTAFIQDQGSSINPQRQAGPHAHCIVTDPRDRFAYVCDLGLDKIMIFKFNPLTGTLAPNDFPFSPTKLGAGPRHIAFYPNDRYAYVANEMGSSLTVFSNNPELGVMGQIEEHSLLPKDFTGENTGAEVAVHPSGKFVFASNRGDNSIVVFSCDPDTGRLAFVERDLTGGKTQRNFEIDPTGVLLLAGNQDSDSIFVFIIDSKTGHLQAVGGKTVTDAPMCIKCLNPSKGP